MANLSFSFDPNSVELNDTYDPIPDGMYNVVVEDTEVRPTKAGTGEYLLVTMRVLDGQYANRKLWDRINVRNPNPKAEEISRITLAKMCQAIGHNQALVDTTVLHNKPMRAKVVIKTQEGWDPKNEIKTYSAVQGQPAQAAPAAPAAAPAADAAPATPPASPPWQR